MISVRHIMKDDVMILYYSRIDGIFDMRDHWLSDKRSDPCHASVSRTGALKIGLCVLSECVNRIEILGTPAGPRSFNSVAYAIQSVQ